MKTKNWLRRYKKDQNGFTLLELVVVVIVVSIVGLVALHHYYKLMVDIERTNMERDLSAMRSSIVLQIAAHYAAGKMAELEGWANGNPMELLVEPPENYRGAIDYIDAQLKNGSWYFHKNRGVLIYLVRNRLYFESELDSPARTEFQLEALFSEQQQGEEVFKFVSGLQLRTIHPYRWISPWE